MKCILWLKASSLYFLLFFISIQLQAQNSAPEKAIPYWVEAMNDPKANYYKALEDFEMFWKNKEVPDIEDEMFEAFEKKTERAKEKKSGDALRYAFEYKKFQQWQMWAKAYVQPDGSILSAGQRWNVWKTKKENHAEAINWHIVGPVNFPPDISGQINGIGRVVQIVFHPSNANKMYAVSASGGVFTSTDAGAHWSSTYSDFLPALSCASLCVDYTNDNVWYLSTGDPNYYGNEAYGMLKTTDGGNNWIQIANGIGARMALSLLQHPNSPNTITAATTDGIWRTNDGGNNWFAVKTGGAFKEMLYKPGSSTTMYAVTDNEVWLSNNGGNSFSLVTSVAPAVGGGGRLAVSPADPKVVYAGFVGTNNNNQGGIIYKSTNSGKSFKLQKGDVSPNLNDYGDGSGDPGQGNYNWALGCDRLNADILYVCGHVVWKSTNGGKKFKQLTDWYADCHTDMHHIIVSPYNNSKLYNANDGGVFISTDGGDNWDPSSDGLGATEVYHMGASKIAITPIGIGTQDNGELYFNNNTWYTNRGGDFGSYYTFDYANPSTAYYHADGTRRDLILNTSASYNLVNYANSDLLAMTPKKTTIAFAAQNADLKRTKNLLDAVPSWSSIKTFTNDIAALDISTANGKELFVVTKNNKVFFSSDATISGPNFNQLSNVPSAINNSCFISQLKSNTNIVYMSCNEKVYRSSDKGASWTDISAGISPAITINSLVQDIYATDESMYLSTAQGVYYRSNSTGTWQYISFDLASIANITGMTIFNDGTSNSVLRVCTYGRGVWESNLYSAKSPINTFTLRQTPLTQNLNDDGLNELQIIPNPARNTTAVIITSEDDAIAAIQVLGMSGQPVLWRRQQLATGVNKIELPLTGLQDGVYYIAIRMHEKTITKKLVVQK